MTAKRLGPGQMPYWPALLSVELAAAYLSVSPNTLRALEPPKARVGGRVLYHRADLDGLADRLAGRLASAPTTGDWTELLDDEGDGARP